ncbi:MAG TPA: hypothetical protein VMG12_33385, partial [Polyangiaceae bacterium]|nr:hypothetical protein [Polyangiaceae bacterium]
MSPAAPPVTPPLARTSLRRAFAQHFQVGAAVGGKLPASLEPSERELLVQHFGVLTPENCMKPGPIHP